MEQEVIACNTALRARVMEMDEITLLRNMHPSNRGDYATLCVKEGLISSEQAHKISPARK